MDMSTSIAQLSTAMSQASVQQGIGTAMLKKSMDMTADMMAGTLEMMNDISPVQTFPGDIGVIFDVRA